MTQEEISLKLDEMVKRYFQNLEYQFRGLYKKDTPEIALRSLQVEIRVNEKHLNIRNDQFERALVHELQHVKDNQDKGWNDNNESHYVWGFVLHPKFKDLYTRLEKYYKKKFEEGAKLSLEFSPLPQSFNDISETKDNYASPSEVLARLRGYEHYLNQVKEGVEVETLPYESIEAFKEEDLKFLDLGYRKELTDELKLKNPEIFKREIGEKVVIEDSDLAPQRIS